MSFRFLASAAGVLAVVPHATAAFSSRLSDNLAVYWGQNSAGGIDTQQRLAQYCRDAEHDIIPLAFMNGITPPITNFASASNQCTSFPEAPELLQCPEIEEDIKTCQNTYNKTVILSLGGATYSQGGWPTTAIAERAALSVWEMFGPAPPTEENPLPIVDPDPLVLRPFGQAVVDGFDFDFEVASANLPAFAAKLRELMSNQVNSRGDAYLLTAAPQCVFPDAALGATLDAVPFDIVMVQFYNNWCGLQNFQVGSDVQTAFNFEEWHMWATTGQNTNTTVMLGIPASATAAGSGYTSGDKLKAIIDYCKKFHTFGGVMMWDMSQLYRNTGFLQEVLGYLG